MPSVAAMPPSALGHHAPVKNTVASRLNAFTDLVAHYDEIKANDLERRRLHSRVDDAVDPPQHKERLPGESRLREFENILENGFQREDGQPLVRSRFQREFHSCCTCAMAPSIVGKADWEKKGVEISKARKWEQRAKMALGVSPRRFGKSASVGMLAVARAEVMIVKDPVTKLDIQAIFSTGRRASTNLGEYCYRFAIDRGLGPRIVKYTEETLWIRGGLDLKDRHGPLAKIYFYPSNPKISSKDLLDCPRTLSCFGPPQGAVYWTNGRTDKKMGYRGITEALRRRFYPDFKRSQRPRHGRSSKAVGSSVHRHIYHRVHCADRGYCLCDKRVVKEHPYAGQAFAALKSMEATPEACEVPVVSHAARKATRLDMIATRWKEDRRARRSAVISVKTSDPSSYRPPKEGIQMLAAPLAHVKSTPANHDQLQSACEIAMLRDGPGVEFDDYFILYLGPKREATIKPLDKWATSLENQRAILSALAEKLPPKPRKKVARKKKEKKEEKKKKE